MSRPIKDTPVLYGKESDRFLKEVKENEFKKIPYEEFKRTQEIYQKIMANAKI